MYSLGKIKPLPKRLLRFKEQVAFWLSHNEYIGRQHLLGKTLKTAPNVARPLYCNDDTGKSVWVPLRITAKN